MIPLRITSQICDVCHACIRAQFMPAS